MTLASTALSLTDSISEYASEPALVLQTVGGELASSAVFFMTYLMILEGFGLPFKELTRAVPILIWLLTKSAKGAADRLAAAKSFRKGGKGGTAGKGGKGAVPGDEPDGGAPKGVVTADSVGCRVTAAEGVLLREGSGGEGLGDAMEVEARLSSRSKGAEESGEAKGEDGEEKEPEKFPDEQFPYMVNWAKVMLATTFGMCCAAHLTPAPTLSPTPNPNSSPSRSPSPSPSPSPSLSLALARCYAAIQPVALLFSGSYLFLSYLFYARGLLFSYTHASESRGAFWPSASARLQPNTHYISPISSLYLPYISPPHRRGCSRTLTISPLYLPYVSPISPLRICAAAAEHAPKPEPEPQLKPLPCR